MFPTSTMYAINESPVGDLPLHFIPFPVRPMSSSEMASEQKSRREGFGGSCALRPLVLDRLLIHMCHDRLIYQLLLVCTYQEYSEQGTMAEPSDSKKAVYRNASHTFSLIQRIMYITFY